MEHRPQPALERDLHKFYQALFAVAETDADLDLLVFSGSPTELFKQLKINPRYYTPIRKILLATESITILQQGNRASFSVWVLNHPPPPQEKWPEDLTGAQVSATMRVEFERRIVALESWRESLTTGGINIPEVLRNFELRIAKLEKDLASLKTATQRRKVGR